jgi:hypothetical protein
MPNKNGSTGLNFESGDLAIEALARSMAEAKRRLKESGGGQASAEPGTGRAPASQAVLRSNAPSSAEDLALAMAQGFVRPGQGASTWPTRVSEEGDTASIDRALPRTWGSGKEKRRPRRRRSLAQSAYASRICVPQRTRIVGG